MIMRIGLRGRILLFFVAIALGSIVALGMGLWFGYHRQGSPDMLNAFVQGGLVAGFVLVGVVAWVWSLFDTHVAKAIERLAGTIRSRSHGDVAGELDRDTARYLGDLAPAVGAALASLSETRNALAESVARETTRLAREKARLEALLSDVPVGVLLCSGAHQLVFYNGLAQDLLGTQGGVPGLDRRLFDYLREGPIRHAHQRLIETADPDAASDLLCATAGPAPRLLAARMRLLLAPGQDTPGYVLTLRDVTADLAAHTRREQLLAEVFDRVRRPAANLQTVMGVLAEDQGADPGGALDRAMRDEVALLTRAITELGARYDEGRTDWWPLAMTRASDLADSARARFEAAGLGAEGAAAELLLRCNGFEIIALLFDLAARIAARTGVRAFRLDILEDGPGAMIVLGWSGAPLSVGLLDGWLTEPLEVGVADVTGRSVLYTHATECWPEHDAAAGTARLVLPIRQARRAGRRPKPIARAVVYDFDLLSRARAEKVADTPLDQLTYVVFDTETTGLMPAQGDEIVQIAAVRLVNGRRVEGEVFDTLVNPGRPIPPGSTEVHGITDAMVAEADPVSAVLPRFHRFAEGAVLVAHNAPFDMEFLRRREAELGLAFDNPILDTVLLSAVVWGQSETHSLDALTHRLGITIPEEARHTAIGDTVATADAFLKLVPMLQARGFRTYGEVLAEVRRHGRLLKDANQRKAG
ncbi:MAG: exonuclease domain-containing protein [Gemmobacter sp.]